MLSCSGVYYLYMWYGHQLFVNLGLFTKFINRPPCLADEILFSLVQILIQKLCSIVKFLYKKTSVMYFFFSSISLEYCNFVLYASTRHIIVWGRLGTSAAALSL